jgi:hypothetical protein
MYTHTHIHRGITDPVGCYLPNNYPLPFFLKRLLFSDVVLWFEYEMTTMGSHVKAWFLLWEVVETLGGGT